VGRPEAETERGLLHRSIQQKLSTDSGRLTLRRRYPRRVERRTSGIAEHRRRRVVDSNRTPPASGSIDGLHEQRFIDDHHIGISMHPSAPYSP
jgi:hypothetical protein